MPQEALAAEPLALQQVEDLQPASSKVAAQTAIERHLTSFIFVLFVGFSGFNEERRVLRHPELNCILTKSDQMSTSTQRDAISLVRDFSA